MTWHGPALEENQSDLASMLGDFAAHHDIVLSDDPEVVGGIVAELVELGVWTLGVAEEHGGGGADQATTSVALVQLGRSWPALGLAAAQAHAAAGLLAGDDRCTDLLQRVHGGTAAVAVVESGSTHVRLHWTTRSLRGYVDRVDAAAQTPYLLVLNGEDSALLVDPSALTTTPLERTGLAGAFTRSLDVDARSENVMTLTGVDAPAARARLRAGIAAVAGGIAVAAADAAAEYAAGRYQFGDALTAISTVRQSLLAQATRTAVILDTVMSEGDEDPLRGFAAARQACDGAVEVAAAALQSHGGYGYLAEYPVERHLRDAVSLRAAADLPDVAYATAHALVGLESPAALNQEAS